MARTPHRLPHWTDSLTLCPSSSTPTAAQDSPLLLLHLQLGPHERHQLVPRPCEALLLQLCASAGGSLTELLRERRGCLGEGLSAEEGKDENVRLADRLVHGEASSGEGEEEEERQARFFLDQRGRQRRGSWCSRYESFDGRYVRCSILCRSTGTQRVETRLDTIRPIDSTPSTLETSIQCTSHCKHAHRCCKNLRPDPQS
jgi:hypothetical protein